MGFEIFDGVRHFLGYRNNGLELAEIAVFRAVGHHLAVVACLPRLSYRIFRRFGVPIDCIGRVDLSYRFHFRLDTVTVQSRRAEPFRVGAEYSVRAQSGYILIYRAGESACKFLVNDGLFVHLSREENGEYFFAVYVQQLVFDFVVPVLGVLY